VAGRASGADRLHRHAIADGDEILGELFLANKRSARRFHRAGPGTAAAARRARRDRAGERAALRAQQELSIMEERNRIARELHDAVTQKLSACA